MQKCVGIDFENANCERTSACSLGLVVLDNFKITERRYWLIKPPTSYFKPEFIQIHGLQWDDVKDSPAFDEIWHEIEPYLSNRLLFAHNAGFDIGGLRALVDFYHLKHKKITYFDTLQLSKTAWKHLSSHKLNRLAEYMGKSFRHHNALEDAEMCANIVIKLVDEFQASDAASLVRQFNLKIKKM